VTSNNYLPLPTQTQLVSRISQLIGFSPSFIFLSGVSGSGRTFICQQLLNTLDASLAVGYIQLQPEMELSRVREQIVLQLMPNAVFDANAPLNETLSRIITDLTHPRLLIVDNADSLASDWAFELWQWLAYADELYPSHKISVLLIGSSEFSEYLAQHLKGREQTALEIEVESLSLKEQKKLLVHYLQIGDVSAAQAEQALTQLTGSRGNPRDIVAIAEAYMDKKSTSSSKITTLPVNKIVAAVAVLAGAVLLLSWVIPSLSKKEVAQPTTSMTQQERQAVSLAPATSSSAPTSTPDGVVASGSVQPAAVTQESVVSSATTSTGIDAEPAADDSNKRRVVISDQALQQIDTNQPATESAVVDNASKTVVTAATPTTATTVTSVNQLKPIVNEIKGDSQVVTRSEVVKHEVVPSKKTVVAKTPHEEKKITENRALKKKNKPAVEHEIVKNSAVAAKSASNSSAATGKGFALQLAASGDSVALKKLAASAGVQAKTKIYKNESTGKYVLIYGEYASAAAAKAAVNGLPASLKNTKPWAKSYTQIRTEQGK
jgi:DamX protein